MAIKASPSLTSLKIPLHPTSPLIPRPLTITPIKTLPLPKIPLILRITITLIILIPNLRYFIILRFLTI